MKTCRWFFDGLYFFYYLFLILWFSVAVLRPRWENCLTYSNEQWASRVPNDRQVSNTDCALSSLLRVQLYLSSAWSQLNGLGSNQISTPGVVSLGESVLEPYCFKILAIYKIIYAWLVINNSSRAISVSKRSLFTVPAPLNLLMYN